MKSQLKQWAAERSVTLGWIADQVGYSRSAIAAVSRGLPCGKGLARALHGLTKIPPQTFLDAKVPSRKVSPTEGSSVPAP